MLFYHTTPQILAPFADEIPFPAINDSEMIELAEQSDIIYSVGEKTHWYYNARFRNRASREIDNRLFLPQNTKEVFNVLYNPDLNSQNVNLLTIVPSGDLDDTLSGLDIVLCSTNKVAVATIEGATTRPSLTLTIGITGGRLHERTDEIIKRYATSAHLKIEIHIYSNWEELNLDLSSCHLILAPTRCELMGHIGLLGLSVGVPTIVAANGIISQIIKRLAVDPEGIFATTFKHKTETKK